MKQSNRSRFTAAIVACAALEASADAASIQFDFGADGAYDGTEAPAHAVGLLGGGDTTWNEIVATGTNGAGTTSGLKYTDGTDATGVTLQHWRSGNYAFPIKFNGASVASLQAIYDTSLVRSSAYYVGSADGARVQGLAPGTYNVYAIVLNPDDLSVTNTVGIGVGVAGATISITDPVVTDTTVLNPATPSGSWVDGENYAVGTVTTTSTSDYINVLVTAPGRITGLQFVEVVPPATTLGLSDFSYDPTTGNCQVSLAGEANMTYKLVEADDLDFGNPDQDPVPLSGATVGGLKYSDTAFQTNASGYATVQFNLGTAKSATFVRAESVPPPPPLLAEDFESGLQAGWSVSDNGNGTAWSVGTPNDTGTEPAAPAGGTLCGGTNINGNYTNSAGASLVTSSFTVPPGGATLTLSYYIDTELETGGEDFGTIRLLNAADDTPLAGGDVATGLQGVSETWLMNQSLPLPAAANGLEVKIEFAFESDADNENYAGFYIDDVVVTGN